jgi:hypothetical protein
MDILARTLSYQYYRGSGKATQRWKTSSGSAAIRDWTRGVYGEDIHRMAATEAYCVKCREKREMANAEEVTMKNGRKAMQGKCPVCGTKLFRILGGKAK